jgi:hypothetical protein
VAPATPPAAVAVVFTAPVAVVAVAFAAPVAVVAVAFAAARVAVGGAEVAVGSAPAQAASKTAPPKSSGAMTNRRRIGAPKSLDMKPPDRFELIGARPVPSATAPLGWGRGGPAWRVISR